MTAGKADEKTLEERRGKALEIQRLSVSFGSRVALRELSMTFKADRITSIIGPSGSGKTTLLRSLNRLNELQSDCQVRGEVRLGDFSLYDPRVDPVEVRARIGMVFERPNPFPTSILENLLWAPRLNGFAGDEGRLVKRALKSAALWDEVREKLRSPALALPLGQQQRLCIARALAMEPEVLLLDEPCAGLDPASASFVEDLLTGLRGELTIILATHDVKQAARVSDDTALVLGGELIEYGPTREIFTRPKDQRTEDALSGRLS